MPKSMNVSNPAYSLCYVEDRPYTDGTGESSLNPLNPSSDRPLVMGEWLQPADISNRPRWQRGGGNGDGTGSPTAAGTLENEGTIPAFPYFMEKGRYDAQASKLVHCIVGPSGYFLRTQLIDTSSLSVGDQLSVWDWDGPTGKKYGVIRRVLGPISSGYCVGRVHRIHGDNDVTVQVGVQ